MSDKLIDLLKADHKARVRKVEILGVAVYVAPLTVGESARATAMHPNDSAQRQAQILVMKCRDEAGAPLFSSEDKPALVREVAGDALGPIFAALNGDPVEIQAEK
jgi:hypothetical protein